MIGVTNKPFTLSVIMLNDVILTVVMLSFVMLAPFHLPKDPKGVKFKNWYNRFQALSH